MRTSIGGFLPLERETVAGDALYHRDAIALASGRACFHAILRAVQPRRVWLPFYICDTTVQPLLASGTPFEFYAIDERFEPIQPFEPAARELTLVVNYFGVQAAVVAALADRLRGRAVIDDTQAFFRRGTADVWSFNSVRKFFGVPDGGYLYGPALRLGELPPSDSDDVDHLIRRGSGDDGAAWEQFKAHEARVSVEPRRMSDVTARLMRGVDMDRARRARQLNFARLHEGLGPMNTIAVPLGEAASAGPMCYPFLPDRDVERTALADAGLFVPTLWPDLELRCHAGFAWERRVARRLLPLPIDHRYDAADMDTIVQRIHQVLR